jgi:hypothetical protein
MELLKPCVLALLITGCVPELDTDESTITETRVLAIQAEPAEQAPTASTPVTYRALVAGPGGIRSDVPITWFQCLAQKPLAELGPVSPDCLNTSSGKLAGIGQGQQVQVALPRQACSLFGPNPPMPMQGEAPGRPVDPDQTGGYKLPVVAAFGSESGTEVALYEQRIYCGLAAVPPAISVQYTQRYHVNTNPALGELRVLRAGGSTVLAADQALELAPNERVELELTWPSCPASDVCGDDICGPDETVQGCAADCQPLRGCGGQERYLYYDTERAELVVRREALRVAWYATAGRYDDERTGLGEDELATSSTNTFTAPNSPGPGTLSLVLRDSRGGVGFRSLPLLVR